MNPLIVPFGVIFVGAALMVQQPARDQPQTPPAGTGVIRGRVVRADSGEPLRRVQVRVEEWSSGERPGAAATMTDAEGKYELAQLPAGRYTLRATRGGYVEAAYGQRRPFDRGRPLELGEGAGLQNIDFALQPGGLLTGRVVDEVGEPVAQATVSLARHQYIQGRKRLVAQNGSSSEFASTELVVGGSDVNGVTLVMSKGATARGRIRFDTGPPEGLRPHQVLIMPVFLDQQMGGMSVRGDPLVIQDDWSFELRGLRGRGFLSAGTANDWQMKRIRRQGIDVTDTPLDFASNIDELEIELTDRVSTVSGGVSDDRGRAVLDATVIVFADDPAKWVHHLRSIQSARPDQQGRFTIRGLPPGKYVAIAVDYLEPGEERDPELLAGWRPRGMIFTLSEGETHALDLKLSGS